MFIINSIGRTIVTVLDIEENVGLTWSLEDLDADDMRYISDEEFMAWSLEQ